MFSWFLVIVVLMGNVVFGSNGEVSYAYSRLGMESFLPGKLNQQLKLAGKDQDIIG